MAQPVVVHHLDNSRSHRVLWLLEELGVPYEVKHYARDPKTLRAPASLTAVHPLGKSPVVSVDDQVLAESGAIVEFLIARFGQGRLIPPSGSPERLRYTYFLHYAEGSLMPLLLLSLVFTNMPKGPMPFFVRPIAKAISQRGLGILVRPQLTQHLDFLEGELQKSTWFAGEELSGADIQMSYPLEAAATRAGIDSSRPKLLAYLERMRARPAYQRALKSGGELKLPG
ncbi:MAG: glutathione S-transferase [Polyangiaceae bacterium]